MIYIMVIILREGNCIYINKYTLIRTTLRSRARLVEGEGGRLASEAASTAARLETPGG